ncbi:MAG TPA: hypothetical protein VLJ62_04065 [Burkholderiaceae bacterium]|nr:hypothetical protein [Burkholderiaceae bacterium]
MLRETLPLSIACALVSPAQAAGGHHAVDDAAILEAGQCQVETWFDRSSGAATRLWHAGPACRVGSAELGLNLDATRSAGGGRTTVAGAQAKWAWPMSEQIHVGAVVGASWQDEAPRRVGSTVVIPLTWRVSDALQVHVNVGRDFLHAAPDAGRRGVAVEWSATPDWSFVAERYRELHTHRWRLGARRALGANASVDLSHARGLGAAPSSWTLGLNWLFDR